jgi:N-acyl-D-aspartate/D-glutamate deacylase
MRSSLLPAVVLFVVSQAIVAAAEGPVDAELLLVGGTLHDGSGSPGVVGDVAITKGRITAVGKFQHGKIDQTLECGGLVVAPGFIDLHSHSDSPIVDRATRANVNFVTQGCTTVVTGNCGMGPIDAGAYFKKIDAAGAGTNVIHLLPHGALRDAAMGKSARDPTSDEVQKMRDLAQQALRDGAWGMATGLIYVPGTYSKTSELVEVARIVGEHGGIYASHIRGEGTELATAIAEALEIGREAKLPVHISHFKASGNKAWGTLHVAVEMIEAARKKGQTVTADQYPYTASSTSLEATLLPAWSREGGRKGIEARLADAVERAKIGQAVERTLDGHVRIQIAGYNPRRDWVGKSLEEIAAAENRPTVDIALEMEENGGARIVNFGMSEDDVRMAMRLPWVATASDGSAKVPDADQPHPRNFGTFPRKLGLYARQEKVVTLPHAVRSATGLPADILQLSDRGYLRVGYAADVTVFDPKTIADRADYDHPYRYSTGIKYVLVGGVPTLYDGVPTGALPGRALRHTSAKAKANSD